MNAKVGVMGSSGGDIHPEVRQKCFDLGRAIARHGCVVITGACPGLPYESILGAKAEGGLTVGISPGLSLEEHVTKYQSPVEGHDVLIFTGSGLMGREITNIRSCDVVVIVGGRSGTLGELAIAYDEDKTIGVLEGTGGIADHVDDIIGFCGKVTNAKIIYDSDPDRLVRRLLDLWHTASPGQPE
jgi:hypothetical protein